MVCYRLAEHTGDPRYRRAADTVLNYLKALQSTGAERPYDDPEIVGAIGGSFPLVGAYMSNGFPCWATKFCLDALLCQRAYEGRRSEVGARGAPLESLGRPDDSSGTHAGGARFETQRAALVVVGRAAEGAGNDDT